MFSAAKAGVAGKAVQSRPEAAEDLLKKYASTLRKARE